MKQAEAGSTVVFLLHTIQQLHCRRRMRVIFLKIPKETSFIE